MTVRLEQTAAGVEEGGGVVDVLKNFHGADDIELLALFDEGFCGTMTVFEIARE